MNKGELLTAIAEKTGLTKKDVEAVVNAFTATVTEEMAKGEAVQLIGFATFDRKKQNERVSFGTTVPAKYVPHVKFGSACKNAVAEAKVQ